MVTARRHVPLSAFATETTERSRACRRRSKKASFPCPGPADTKDTKRRLCCFFLSAPAVACTRAFACLRVPRTSIGARRLRALRYCSCPALVCMRAIKSEMARRGCAHAGPGVIIERARHYGRAAASQMPRRCICTSKVHCQAVRVRTVRALASVAVRTVCLSIVCVSESAWYFGKYSVVGERSCDLGWVRVLTRKRSNHDKRRSVRF